MGNFRELENKLILKKGVKSMFNGPCTVETFYKENMNTVEFNDFLTQFA